jgi:NAD(P)-dependent dehydrogenase (short-subunit alcohol dehydrogenase family)
MCKRFENKVAIVTGAGSGIGLGAALAFAQEGAAVVVVDISSQKAEAAVNTIRETGGKALSVTADVSRAEDAQRISSQAVATFGGVDVLANIAGIQTYGTVVDTDEATWDRTIDTNLKSMYLVSKYCVPEMIKRGGGSIVNMASVQGLASQRNVVAYTASKGGVLAMTRTMALDHALQNIRVNSVCPGTIDTPMLQWAANQLRPDNPQEVIKEWGKIHALDRVGKVEEVAQVILFLASDAASFITGTQIIVDGGLLAKID